MLFTIFSVFYVLIAAAMIVLILMQRGDGANAGASFGGGASGTVFGARGSASFLTRTTAVLAGLFFLLSLGMGIYLSKHGVAPSPKQALGVMAGVGSSAPASATTAAVPAGAPAGSAASSSAQPSEVPAAPAASAAAKSDVPAAPAKSSAPASSAPSSGAPSSH
ncbi:MAG: Protein translocase membrane subunit SecG [Rhodanobacteraceae bacterium]|jgi:preprotein translocase subunit SecG|nr:MAG: Protein translocase membrane subunit SecG [Rhodanobacteraceae bacterium]